MPSVLCRSGHRLGRIGTPGCLTAAASGIRRKRIFDGLGNQVPAFVMGEADGNTPLSAEVKSALRAEFTRSKRQWALADLLDHLADERGDLDTAEDQAEIARYMRLLGGVADEPGQLQSADAAGSRCRGGERTA
jgi:hypothetical protein